MFWLNYEIQDTGFCRQESMDHLRFLVSAELYPSEGEAPSKAHEN